MKVVVRIGGSVLGAPPEAGLVSEYSGIIAELANDHHIGIVVGGGDVAREYIQVAKELGLSSEDQDKLAIQVSRLNARLVGLKLNGQDMIPESVKTMIAMLKKKRIVVMAGLKPGVTTDTVAVVLVRDWNADLLVKASNQRGIYTSDPSRDENARLLTHVSYEKLRKILGGKHIPGIHSIIDSTAVNEIVRHKIRLIVVDGSDPKNLRLAVNGAKVGTKVP